MKFIHGLIISLIFGFGVLAQTEIFVPGKVYSYTNSQNLKYTQLNIQKKTFSTNVIETFKTYEVDTNTFEVITETNGFVTLVFPNNSVIKLEQNSEFRIDDFNLIITTNKFPTKVEYVSYNMNLSLMSGNGYFSISKNTNDQFLLQTPISNIGIESGKFYVQVNPKSVLVYVLEGSINIHDNVTNKKESIKSGNAVLINPFVSLSPRQMELFADKMSTVVKKLTTEQMKPIGLVLQDLDDIKNRVLWSVIDTNIIGIRIK